MMLEVDETFTMI